MAVQSIDDLVQTVANDTAVMDSATTLINGFSARLQQAIQDSLQGGASQADLAPLTDLKAQLDTHAQSLANAVAANTPAQQGATTAGTTNQPPPPPPMTPPGRRR